MIENPADQPYPEGIYKSITIKARQLPGPVAVWEVFCPEWKCTLHDKNLTRCVAGLCAEIEDHNDNTGNEDYNDWAEKNGLPKLKQEHWPAPRRKVFGTSPRKLVR